MTESDDFIVTLQQEIEKIWHFYPCLYIYVILFFKSRKEH